MSFRSPLNLAAILFALAVLGAACGDSDDTATAADAGSGTTSGDAGQDTSQLSGDIFITGSSTVEPISIRVAESFEEVAPDVVVDVEGPGTGDGFLKFCNGEADISDASRPIKDEEAQTCADNGIDFVELQVAIDGIAVVTSPENDAVECLSFADLYALVGPESEGFDQWADAQAIASELGSQVQFPAAPLDLTAPGTESGTYDSFIEIVLAGPAEEREQEETTRTDYSSAADDNVIVTNVAANATSLGWVGYAFYEENRDSLEAIAISEEPGGECVEPTAETIASGQYPISRPLFIYVSKPALEDNPALAGYVEHYLSQGLDEAVSEAGYVTLDESAKEATRTAWSSR